MAYAKAEVKEARESLLKRLKPGDKIFLIPSRVSRSGMSHVIKCLISTNEAKETGCLMTHETNKPTKNHWESVNLVNISFDVARVIDMSFVDGMMGGVRIGGCGMDMGLQLVDILSYALFNQPICQSRDEDNGGLRYQWI